MEREALRIKLIDFLKTKGIEVIDSSDEDLAKLVIDYFRNCEYKFFSDYSAVIEMLFSVAALIEYEKLEELEYSKAFLVNICLGLRYAGNDGEIGYDYCGITTIRENADKLSYKYISRILKFAENRYGFLFRTSLRDKVMKELINGLQLDISEKKKLKFRFFDSNNISKMCMRKILAYVRKKYTDYTDVDIDELNPTNAQKATFVRAMECGGKRLYIKIDRIDAERMFLSLTPSFEPDDTDYILDLGFELKENDKVEIQLLEKGIQTEKKLEAEFSYSNWEEDSYDNISELNDFFAKILEEIYREEVELVYFYSESTYKMPEKEIYFQNNLRVSVASERISIRLNEQLEMPNNFFGPYINNICAVIGKNGSGKTSIFKMIAKNPIFKEVDKKEYVDTWGNYLIIYRMGNNYYYSKSLQQEVECTESDILLKEREAIVDVNICLISNTFDVQNMYELGEDEIDPDGAGGKLDGFLDFTASNMIKYGMKNFQKLERQSIDNLKEFIKDTDIMEQLELKEYSSLKHLSSGEYARWSLFGRILSIFYQPNKEDSILLEIVKKENYFILFDEAEIYLHPEWQRRLIQDTIIFINKINEGQRFFSNITLMFSSNSPFLMSDLPMEKIQLFEKKQITNTFGQNIYDILRDKFFMDDLAIGAFAQDKINKAFKNKDDMTNEELEEAKYIVNILGDELLVNILRRRLNV